MNLESIENRAQEINKSIIQLTAQLNALHGHLAECTHWKTELEKHLVEKKQEESYKMQEVRTELMREVNNG